MAKNTGYLSTGQSSTEINSTNIRAERNVHSLLSSQPSAQFKKETSSKLSTTTQDKKSNPRGYSLHVQSSSLVGALICHHKCHNWPVTNERPMHLAQHISPREPSARLR
ncbi:hypothetical protein CEXT_633981 [Caerostris extrusa]|uniref:Uncharacterized protein n=1 Tax=Caerostris extrusa TaxID=172846 RepID=A0AAV4XWC4_CAEEX|nr:hypothetical protein CEXT_633981 [Caerostris extrusa]